MFAHPRPKKSPHLSSTSRHRVSATEEVKFDFNARADFLTGFHKRKLERAKKGKEEAAKKAREERIATRKRLREERRNELEKYIESVNALHKKLDRSSSIDSDSETSANKSWNGIQDDVPTEQIDHETEYYDEDRFTTVTIEEVAVSREGLFKVEGHGDEVEDEVKWKGVDGSNMIEEWTSGKVRSKKPRFRYESKAERKASRIKQKAANKARASTRRGNG